MNNSKRYTFEALLVLLVLIAGYFGVKLPNPPIPEPAPFEMMESRGLSRIRIGQSVEMAADLDVAGATTFTGGIYGTTGAEFEGATADSYETTLAVTDATADRTITLPNMTGSVLLTSTPGKIVLGTNTVTTTLQISHGLTTPQTAFCTLLNDSEANGATCTMTISGGTVTLKLWKADGATAGSVGKLISWMVGGQP